MLRRRRPWRRRRFLGRAANRAEQIMQVAHQLYDQGDYLQAGAIYEELAQASGATGRQPGFLEFAYTLRRLRSAYSPG